MKTKNKKPGIPARFFILMDKLITTFLPLFRRCDFRITGSIEFVDTMMISESSIIE